MKFFGLVPHTSLSAMNLLDCVIFYTSHSGEILSNLVQGLDATTLPSCLDSLNPLNFFSMLPVYLEGSKLSDPKQKIVDSAVMIQFKVTIVFLRYIFCHSESRPCIPYGHPTMFVWAHMQVLTARMLHWDKHNCLNQLSVVCRNMQKHNLCFLT